MKHAGILALILSLVALGLILFRPVPENGPSKKNAAFERVMRTRTIRCAYVVRPPHIAVDPNTKQLSGIDYELMEAIGKAADLKIDWQEEVGYGVFPEQINSGKQDAFCSLVLISARRAQRVELTMPIEYMPLHVYAREGDTRFDFNLPALNKTELKMAVIDGSSQKAATDSVFPLASQYALPGDSDNSQTILAVATGKADAVVADDNTIHDYNKRNPDKKMRRVPSNQPVRTYAEAFAVPKGDFELRGLLNAAIHELMGNGTIDKIIGKYEPVPGSILRTQVPYSEKHIK